MCEENLPAGFFVGGAMASIGLRLGLLDGEV